MVKWIEKYHSTFYDNIIEMKGQSQQCNHYTEVEHEMYINNNIK